MKQLFLSSLLVLGACASDLEPTNNGDETPPRTEPAPENKFTQLTIDATGNGVNETGQSEITEDAWVYLSLAQSQLIAVEDRTTDKNWDLGFQRFHVRINGGVSGSAGLKVATLETDFDELTAAPSDATWQEDEKLDEDAAVFPNTGLAMVDGETGWFDMTHDANGTVLSARSHVYVIDTGRLFYKVQILDYYNEDKTGGHVTLRFAHIDAPN